MSNKNEVAVRIVLERVVELLDPSDLSSDLYNETQSLIDWWLRKDGIDKSLVSDVMFDLGKVYGFIYANQSKFSDDAMIIIKEYSEYVKETAMEVSEEGYSIYSPCNY